MAVITLQHTSQRPFVVQPGSDVRVNTHQGLPLDYSSGGWSASEGYHGAAEAIVAAGLARLDEFPGTPGRPKTSVHYASTGEQLSFAEARRRGNEPGHRHIMKRGKDEYSLYVTLPRSVQLRRHAKHMQYSSLPNHKMHPEGFSGYKRLVKHHQTLAGRLRALLESGDRWPSRDINAIEDLILQHEAEAAAAEDVIHEVQAYKPSLSIANPKKSQPL